MNSTQSHIKSNEFFIISMWNIFCKIPVNIFSIIPLIISVHTKSWSKNMRFRIPLVQLLDLWTTLDNLGEPWTDILGQKRKWGMLLFRNQLLSVKRINIQLVLPEFGCMIAEDTYKYQLSWTLQYEHSLGGNYRPRNFHRVLFLPVYFPLLRHCYPRI